MSKNVKKYFLSILLILFSMMLVVSWYYIEFSLPNTQQLKSVQLKVPLQIYTADGQLLGIFGDERRMPIPYAQMPQELINAVIATEDQRYFQHPGVDMPGLLRATVQLIVTGQKEQGGSTITMQLARNFYLSSHKTFWRKFREILLAIKIEASLSKQKILELYLNKIFFGNRAYGVAAAAELYYGKPLHQLSLAQYAMLAGIPKAPSVLNPLANTKAALSRRNHVLTRMFELHYISEQNYHQAMGEGLNAKYHAPQVQFYAPYVADLAKQQAEKIYGPQIYTNGSKIYTTIDSRLQKFADEAVISGVLSYDQRHGYRGPEQNLAESLDQDAWISALQKIPVVQQLEPAAVINYDDSKLDVLRSNGAMVYISWDNLKWARKRTITEDNQEIFSEPVKVQDMVRVGDVVRIIWTQYGWRLAQLPQEEASLVALDPDTGAILALVGGFDYRHSNFNRVTSAMRQPGSSFKPFIYAAALEKGFTLGSVINDSPVVIEDNQSIWRPQNSNHTFTGPTSLRNAIVHSRNLVSIRLLEQLGLDDTIEYILKFGFTREQLPHGLSLALGTGEVTSLQLASAYAIFANGGYKISPYIIQRVETGNRIIVLNQTNAACPTCVNTNTAKRVMSEQNSFLITSALHDVVEYGTAKQARLLGRHDLAGKTGTTQNHHDAWFAGYNKHLVSVAWLGFDKAQSLYEYGSGAALPIWLSFMDHALENHPDEPMVVPDNMVSALIDPRTGKRSSTDNAEAIFEYFTTKNLPKLHDIKPQNNTELY